MTKENLRTLLWLICSVGFVYMSFLAIGGNSTLLFLMTAFCWWQIFSKGFGIYAYGVRKLTITQDMFLEKIMDIVPLTFLVAVFSSYGFHFFACGFGAGKIFDLISVLMLYRRKAIIREVKNES